MIQLKLDLKNISPLAAKLGNLKQAVDTATKNPDFLKSVGQLLVSRGKQNMEDGGSPTVSWPLLAESTRKQKEKKGYSLKPLQREGLLKRSLSWEVSGGLYVSGLDYLKYHQSDEPRTKIPERKVYTVESDDLLDIQDFLIRRFEKKLS
jgi:phage gpG-like protein